MSFRSIFICVYLVLSITPIGKKLNFPIGESVGKLPQYWELVGCIHPTHGKKWYTNRELLMHRLAGPNFGKQSGSFFPLLGIFWTAKGRTDPETGKYWVFGTYCFCSNLGK